MIAAFTAASSTSIGLCSVESFLIASFVDLVVAAISSALAASTPVDSLLIGSSVELVAGGCCTHCSSRLYTIGLLLLHCCYTC